MAPALAATAAVASVDPSLTTRMSTNGSSAFTSAMTLPIDSSSFIAGTMMRTRWSEVIAGHLRADLGRRRVTFRDDRALLQLGADQRDLLGERAGLLLELA